MITNKFPTNWYSDLVLHLWSQKAADCLAIHPREAQPPARHPFMVVPHLSPLSSLGLSVMTSSPLATAWPASLEIDMAKGVWMSGGSLLYWADSTGPPAFLSRHQKAEFLSNKSPNLLLKTYLFIHYFLIQTVAQQIFL